MSVKTEKKLPPFNRRYQGDSIEHVDIISTLQPSAIDESSFLHSIGQ